MGKRPWGYWMIEQGLSHQPQGERGELRLIKQLDLYRDDAEKEFVQKRLAVITAELRSHWHRRVAKVQAAHAPSRKFPTQSTPARAPWRWQPPKPDQGIRLAS